MSPSLKRVLKLPEPFSGHCLAIKSKKFPQSHLQVVHFTAFWSRCKIFPFVLLLPVDECQLLYRGLCYIKRFFKRRFHCSYITHNHPSKLKDLDPWGKVSPLQIFVCTPGLASHTWQTQRAKKVMSDSLGLVDFAFGLVIFVINLPNGQVLFFGEIQITEGL